MKFYKFANGQRINEKFVKDYLITVGDIEEGFHNNTYYFEVRFICGSNGFDTITITFEDEILAKEQLKEFIYYIEHMI